ncbi:HTH-type transcriptional repressor FabR [Alkalimarinus sediminis]|uniref:HTH-type transcriptional repressor FabR n=1 Tax=Alkalimarinus sediminis TaxID=1632866 RepID=A0A9E8KIU7_9ALTE|nr:HTH-type transcriptional repressor FabR [Alkalimarinus sediminis]UZW74301.1 HTH-type transcriptional repressor FabR [Alkalimarinus sediminis]
MLSREDKKRQTRKSLMDAALMLVGKGDNFSSISLREVAKNAGVVPTSFYRHFTDMEELGLNLVDELGMLLRKLMRATRQHDGSFDGYIRSSIDVYVDFVIKHPNHFHFMAQSRTGGTHALRSAIRNELKFFANELASDIRLSPMLPRIGSEDLDMISELIVATVAETTIDILDLVDVSASYQQEFVKKTEKKLRLIWLGAGAWRSPE